MAESFSFDRRLAARTATIDERLNGDFSPVEGPDSGALADKRLEAWCRAAFKGDEARFATWLEGRGLAVDDARHLLGPVKPAEGTVAPAWLATLDRVLSAVENGKGAEEELLDPGSPIPFEDTLAPIAVDAVKRLVRSLPGESPVSDPALRDLGRGLLVRLSLIAAPTLYRDFDLHRHFGVGEGAVWATHLAHLRAGGFGEILTLYPVLGRLLAVTVEQWLESTGELVARLVDDRDAVAALVGMSAPEALSVSRISPGLSDPHNGGRMVMRLMFEVGGAIYYKPRSVDMEEAWSGLCRWLAAEGAPGVPPPLVLLRRPGYGWIREVEGAFPAGGGHSMAYLRRFGGMLCLAHWLGASDLHAENFVQGAEGPVPVDLETLLHPALKRSSGAPPPSDPEGVMATMALPMEYTGHGGQRIVFAGALVEGSFATVSPPFLAVNTDAMHRSPPTPPDPEAFLGRPRRLAGAELDAVRGGFEETYGFLLSRQGMLSADQGPLALFRGCRQRFVYRSTDLYWRLLHHGLEPGNLVDGVAWSLHFDTLRRFDDEGLAADLAEGLHAAERQALARLDIPYFTGESCRLGVSGCDGVIAREAFARSAFEALRERIEAMSLADLAAQREAIRGAYAPGKRPP